MKPAKKTALIAGSIAVGAIVLVAASFWSGSEVRKSGPEKTKNQLEEARAKHPVRGQRAQSELISKLENLAGKSSQTGAPVAEEIAKMKMTDVIEALEVFWDAESTGERRELSQRLLRRWAEEMPHAAAEWISKKPQGELQNEGALNVAIVWANRNLGEAKNWVGQWPDERKEGGLLAVAYEATRANPTEALTIAAELAPSAKRNDLIAHAVREWTTKDPESPVTWAEQLESPVLRDHVMSAVAVALSETDPIKGGTLALEKLPQGNRQDSAVVAIVQRWAQQDPKAAADWVVTFPDGSLRESSIHNLIGLWANAKPTEAATWLDGLEGGRLRDAALSAYSSGVAGTDPASAAEWANKIEDSAKRERELEMLVERWMSVDREKAMASLEELNLSDDSKLRLAARGEELNGKGKDSLPNGTVQAPF